ncbi:YibE/F family protein [Agrococcus sp. Marseille-P2731]|uniref:YibE/F family protein n=1 Tax=Agrococcus sp. Marseille-P2731 TaxID=1841862 RepID=UPI000A3ECFA7|nr:YibE/F family protein [Agrococcus sp. Marseille-P2731]
MIARPAVRERQESRRLGGGGGHAHAHGGSHGGDSLVLGVRPRLMLWLALVPLLLTTLVGLFMLWPSADALPDRVPYFGEGVSSTHATASAVPDPETSLVEARLDDGTAIQVVVPPEALAEVGEGDRLRVFDVPEAAGYGSSFIFIDFAREIPLALLALVFVAVVVLVARWRGLAAIAGLAGAFVAIVGFTLPALLAGQPALPVALVTASVVMCIVLYVAHGFSTRTTTALLGTLIGLLLTGAIAWAATASTRILGTSSEESMVLFQQVGLDLSDVFICGLVLAGMGVLNDVTITQASAVWELRAAAPGASRRDLFGRAMRIGRDHIASTVYTIAFAYVGAALPMLLVLTMMEAPFDVLATTGEVVEEIVRTLVGSIGLVLAIPVTTAIAALIVPGPSDERVAATETAAATA